MARTPTNLRTQSTHNTQAVNQISTHNLAITRSTQTRSLIYKTKANIPNNLVSNICTLYYLPISIHIPINPTKLMARSSIKLCTILWRIKLSTCTKVRIIPKEARASLVLKVNLVKANMDLMDNLVRDSKELKDNMALDNMEVMIKIAKDSMGLRDNSIKDSTDLKDNLVKGSMNLRASMAHKGNLPKDNMVHKDNLAKDNTVPKGNLVKGIMAPRDNMVHKGYTATVKMAK